MQYVGQTCRALQKRFGEHYRRMKKPKPIDTFLYQHFKLTGHSPNDGLVQPVKKLTYDKNSSSKFKIIKRHASRKLLRIKVTPDLHLTCSKNRGNLGLILKMKNIACISILLTKQVKYTYLYLINFVLYSIVAFKAN